MAKFFTTGGVQVPEASVRELVPGSGLLVAEADETVVQPRAILNGQTIPSPIILQPGMTPAEPLVVQRKTVTSFAVRLADDEPFATTKFHEQVQARRADAERETRRRMHRGAV